MPSRKRARLTGVCAALAFSAAFADQDDLTRMERSIELRVSNRQFMGAVLVARDGQPLLSKGYGKANLDWGIPNSPTTKFRLGSVTKQFTAASILLLEERGKLEVKNPIKQYLPDAPAAWNQITIFNLLTHTSGIPDFTRFPDYEKTLATPTTADALVARFRDKPLDFPPGSKYSYSNSGYVLLGYLIEKVSGETYREFVQDNIFVPLGMRDSGYDSNAAIIERRAVGYAPGPSGPVVADYLDSSILFSAGSLYSTTEDLLRWEQGLYGGKLLSAKSLEKMTTPFRNDYAFGLMVDSAPNGDKIIWHNGKIKGFNTEVVYVPAGKLAVIVLANLNGSAAADIAADLRKVALHDAATLICDRVAVTVSADVLNRVAGLYELDDGEVITVSRNQDHLEALGVGPALELYPQSDAEFFSTAEDAQLAFESNRRGRILALVMNRRGPQLRAPRIDEARAKRLADARAEKISSQTADPGSEAALRRSIEQIVAGKPDYERMGQALAYDIHRQLPQMQQTFEAWGPLQSLAFKGVGPRGGDIYDVTFANRVVEFRIRLGPDNKIVGQRFAEN